MGLNENAESSSRECITWRKKMLIMNDDYKISQILINYPKWRTIINISKERWEISNRESKYKTKPKWRR